MRLLNGIGSTQDSSLTRGISIIMLLCVFIAALVYATVEYINGNTVLPALVYIIISSGVTYAQQTLNMHQTSNIMEKTISQVTTPTPL